MGLAILIISESRIYLCVFTNLSKRTEPLQIISNGQGNLRAVPPLQTNSNQHPHHLLDLPSGNFLQRFIALQPNTALIQHNPRQLRLSLQHVHQCYHWSYVNSLNSV